MIPVPLVCSLAGNDCPYPGACRMKGVCNCRWPENTISYADWAEDKDPQWGEFPTWADRSTDGRSIRGYYEGWYNNPRNFK